MICLCLVFSLEEGLSSSLVPPASALLLAASLQRAWTRHTGDNQGFSAALNMLRPDRGEQYRQVRDKTFLYMLKVLHAHLSESNEAIIFTVTSDLMLPPLCFHSFSVFLPAAVSLLLPGASLSAFPLCKRLSVSSPLSSGNRPCII